MKKLIKQIILIALITVLFSITSNVLAATSGALTLTADKDSYEPGEEVTVTVGLSNFKNTARVVDIYGKINYDDTQLELTNITAVRTEGWSGTSNVKSKAFTYGNEDIEGSSNICTLTFKIKDDFEGNAVVSVTPEITEGQGFTTESVTIKVAKKVENPPEQSTPDEPSKPSEPSKPDDTSTPSEPSKPDDSSKPSEPSKPDDSSKPSEPSSSQKPSQSDDKYNGNLPDAGENNIVLTIAAIVFVIVVLILVVNNIKNRNKNNKH